MKDDLNLFENGRRPQSFLNGRWPNFFENGWQPKIFFLIEWPHLFQLEDNNEMQPNTIKIITMVVVPLHTFVSFTGTLYSESYITN